MTPGNQVTDIPEGHLLYPVPHRVAEARSLLRRESLTGERLHPAVRANCEQMLRFADHKEEGPTP